MQPDRTSISTGTSRRTIANGSPCPIIKAFGSKASKSLVEMDGFPQRTLLLDTFSSRQAGGTGTPFPWGLALKQRRGETYPVGRMNSGNVGEAIAT